MTVDATRNTKNYRVRGGGEDVISGKLRIATGGVITGDNGVQAPHIAPLAVAPAASDYNALLTILQNVGIIASS